MAPTITELMGAALFATALLHTFSTRYFEHLAHTRPAHAGLWHFLAEVEVVFGFWAMVFMVGLFIVEGKPAATHYLDSRNFTEPLFVFAIMVTAASRPVITLARLAVRRLAGLLPVPAPVAVTWVVLAFVPLLGSFITEPAAMTLAALLLRAGVFQAHLPRRLKYVLLGTLFVNVSIGGTLTPYAAPPVLMVAATWGWDLNFMLTHMGWKAAAAVLLNASLMCAWGWRVLAEQVLNEPTDATPVPWWITGVHLLFMAGIVAFAHHPAAFMGLFLFFMGFTHAYERHQSPLILREGLLVAFFLAGLVVLGGPQRWWLEPLLMHMNEASVFFGATALTAITDNAALTYLGSLVPGLSPGFQYALVAGAVTGGGLTVIANAPNPAGAAILREAFDEGAIHAGGLLLGAAAPTLVAVGWLHFA